MNHLRARDRRQGLRRVGIGTFQGAALVLILAIAMPIRAVDERAVKSRVSPAYPEIVKRMKIGGAVKLEATVDAQGKVTDIKTVRGNHMLSVAAEDAVRQWKFVPGSGLLKRDRGGQLRARSIAGTSGTARQAGLQRFHNRCTWRQLGSSGISLEKMPLAQCRKWLILIVERSKLLGQPRTKE